MNVKLTFSQYFETLIKIKTVCIKNSLQHIRMVAGSHQVCMQVENCLYSIVVQSYHRHMEEEKKGS